MRNLLDFFIRHFVWLVFAFFVTVSCWLLFSRNPYQHHVYLSSAGSVASSVYRASSSVTSYFGLRDINEDLQRRNAELEREVLQLRHELVGYRERDYADSMTVDPSLARYDFIVAHVINNTIARPHNYITIEKGALDGIRPEMGVVDQNGVVGIVNIVGPHTSRVISLLNPHLRLSAKVKGSQQLGSLVWKGKDSRRAVLEELPRHAKFHRGDTIVTSGFSTAFPEGVPIGRIVSAVRERDDNFYALNIELFTDFSTLSTVRVIDDRMTPELREVEKEIDPEEDADIQKAQ